jgi:hypothetical protein
MACSRLLAVAVLLLVAGCESSKPDATQASTPAPRATPAADPLFCRGGAPASVTSRFDVSGPTPVEVRGRSTDYLVGLVTADLTMKRQVGSAGTNGTLLDPGHCAFAGRSMFDSEPLVLRHYRHETPVTFTWTTQQDKTNAPVVRSVVDEFASDPAFVVSLTVGPEPDATGVSRILLWERVPSAP